MVREDLKIIDVPVVSDTSARESIAKIKESRDFYIYTSLLLILGALFFWAQRQILLMVIFSIATLFSISKLANIVQKLQRRIAEQTEQSNTIIEEDE